MRISPGSRLGPYEISARLGAGGMGEVWKARDTRLERSVAVKVLPTELAANSQLRQRFEREAKTISQLNHPHICTLYDVGDGYLVMELLEGEPHDSSVGPRTGRNRHGHRQIRQDGHGRTSAGRRLAADQRAAARGVMGLHVRGLATSLGAVRAQPEP